MEPVLAPDFHCKRALCADLAPDNMRMRTSYVGSSGRRICHPSMKDVIPGRGKKDGLSLLRVML